MSTSTPTQIRRPRQAVARTTFAVVIALAAMAPLIVDAAGVDEAWPPVAGVLAIAGAITRVMALPSVEAFLARFVPWLAADPPPRALRRFVDVAPAATARADVLVASVVCSICPTAPRFELPITTTLWGFTAIDDLAEITVTAPTAGAQAFVEHMNQHRADGTFTDRYLEHADQLAINAARIREQRARE